MSDPTSPHEGHSGYENLRERKTIAEILETVPVPGAIPESK